MLPLPRHSDTASAPIAALLLIVAMSGIAFESIVYFDDLAESTGNIITTITVPDCSNQPHWWDAAICGTGAIFIILANVILVIASVVVFFYNALTYNVAGAPSYVRVIVSTIMVSMIGWNIASLIRGVKA